VRGTGEGVPSDGLCRPGVDEAEGAEQHGGPEGWQNPAPSIRIAGEVRRDTQCAPTWCANYRGSLPPTVDLYQIVCQTRMVGTGDMRVYTGSGLLRVIPYVQSRVIVFLCQGSL
jgi:hypothetical protein